MGSSTSKAAKTASKLSASNTARKYPTRPPPPSSNRANISRTRPIVPEPLAVKHEPSITKEGNQEIIQDSQDSDAGLLARLQSLGPVQPNPTLSNSSTFHFSPRPPLQHARNQTNSSSSSPLSQNSATPAPPRLQSLAPATAPAPNHDPSLIHTTFAPSPSNPLQTIFPSTSAHTDLKQGRNQNPALSLLTARHRLAEAAEHEFAQTGKANATGREFLDVMTLRQILALRDEKGVSALEIENSLGLKSGVVERLGGSGVVGVGS